MTIRKILASLCLFGLLLTIPACSEEKAAHSQQPPPDNIKANVKTALPKQKSM